MNRKHSLREMTKIQAEFERRFGNIPGIVGIGIGKGDNGDYALKVYVDDSVTVRRIPRSFDDVQVSIDVSGGVSAY